MPVGPAVLRESCEEHCGSAGTGNPVYEGDRASIQCRPASYVFTCHYHLLTDDTSPLSPSCSYHRTGWC